MPTYDYFCPANGRTVEVFHGFSQTLTTWGELLAAGGLPGDGTPDETPIERVISGGTFLQRGAAPQQSTPC